MYNAHPYFYINILVKKVHVIVEVLRYLIDTMSHIVESCPLTKLNGGLSRLHSADEDAVSWLTNYGKWHAYEKKKIADRSKYSHVSKNAEISQTRRTLSCCCFSTRHASSHSMSALPLWTSQHSLSALRRPHGHLTLTRALHDAETLEHGAGWQTAPHVWPQDS